MVRKPVSPPPALPTTACKSVLKDEKPDVDIGIAGIIAVTLAFIPSRPPDTTPDNAPMPPGVPRLPLRLRNPATLVVNCPCKRLIFTVIPQVVGIYPPAFTLDEPTATLVHPEIPSPILPAPLPFTFTVLDPDAIGAT